MTEEAHTQFLRQATGQLVHAYPINEPPQSIPSLVYAALVLFIILLIFFLVMERRE